MDDRHDHLDWRPVVAALANPHSRRMFAHIVLGDDPAAAGRELSPSRRSHALEVLRRAGLIRAVDGGYIEQSDVFGRLLAAAPGPERPKGVERFLTGAGKIDRYPSDAQERRELLELLARRAVEEGEVVPEAVLNDRLSAFSDDTATLRRYLVDLEILERTPSGSEYARVVGTRAG
ncbi:DUF2087 domain-containing protein [Pseudactinotalea sp. Z1732]|uniref:DUF2087 domain-containing protein n=1 Tax=Micrococcales TaxID=85006 RepID=UPI003C7C244F